MLIFIHLILYIFICSLQSLTKNVYGIEDPSNNNPKQLKSIYDKDEHPLTIERYKRYPGDGGPGDGGGDSGGGCGGGGGPCGCGGCPSSFFVRPRRPPYTRRIPPIRRKNRPKPTRRHRKIRRHWWLRRYVVIEY
uniref:Candidate secreted effector n=1 Tax=Meloidogyne incognita TaxID=6306 RepID=A0A914L0R0_MELIC